MSQIVRLNVPDEVAQRAREVAARTRRNLEDVLLDWLRHAADELPMDSLSDSQVLALADLEMRPDQQNELSELLALNREGELDTEGQQRLDELMSVYRNGMVRKAHALKEAVARGLRPPIGQP